MRGTKPTLKTDRAAISQAARVPAWLSKDAKNEWRRVMPLLIERRVVTEADLGCVEAYCVAIGRIRELERMIQANPGDQKLYRLQTQSTQVARQLAAELGLTPVSRSRPAIRDEAEDELTGLDI